LKKSRAIALSSLYLQQALKQNLDATKKILTKLDQAEKDFKLKRKIALSSSQLPKAKSNDAKRLEIAKQILQIPKYEFGEFGPIVLTTEKIIQREKKTSQLKIDDAKLSLSGDVKFSGTETSWTYKWQEFKFAVPLKEDNGTWFIWWITAKKFSSGSAKTPIGNWISGSTTKGNPIPKENF
jgi:hypothetical protein